jgi:hypothetical protein
MSMKGSSPKPLAAGAAGVRNLTLSNTYSNSTVSLKVEVGNTGTAVGDEVIIAYWRPSEYVHPVNSSYMRLQRQVFDFARISSLAPSKQATVILTLSVDDLVLIDKDGNRVSRPGQYDLVVSRGPSEPELSVGLALTGATRVLEKLPPATSAPWS